MFAVSVRNTHLEKLCSKACTLSAHLEKSYFSLCELPYITNILFNVEKMSSKMNGMINSSILHDKCIYANQTDNDTTLRNNYAPIHKLLQDTLGTRNKHPLARYTQKIPIYPNMHYCEQPLVQIARKQAELMHDKIHIDRVTLDKNQATGTFDDKVLTPSSMEGLTKAEQNQNYLNPQSDMLRQMQRNKRLLDNLVFVRNPDLLDERRYKLLTTAELENTYPLSTSRLTLQTPTNQVSSDKVKFIHSKPSETFKMKEAYSRENRDDTYLDQVYIQALEARLNGVIYYVLTNKVYSPWTKNWKSLEKAVKNNQLSFSRLDVNEKEIAYTVNKGEQTRFRIRGKNTKYVPLNIYQYVMLHEAAHCANFGSWGHGADFKELLSLLTLAAYEIGMINLEKIPSDLYMTDGQPILSKGDIKAEISSGIDSIESKNPHEREHYEHLREHVLKHY